MRSDQDRIPLWHSIANPEENFGLLAFNPAEAQFQQYAISGNNTSITSCFASADAEFLHLKIHFNAPMQTNDSLWIGLDTYQEALGESILPNQTTTSKRAEFALLVMNDSAKLYVTQAYDPFGIWFHQSINDSPDQQYHSTVTNGAPWRLLRLKNSTEDSAFQKIGLLKVKKDDNTATSCDAVWFSGNDVFVRLPWHYLNFTDPSALLVLDDDRNTSERETSVSDGIALTISYKKELATTSRFLWTGWDSAPATTEKVKSGLSIITSGNAAISDVPVTLKKSGKKKR